MMTATYSPEDNKLRLYSSGRLDSGMYSRVKAAGFSWAPKQELFVAPAWSPDREDLLVELAGEIGDEDTSLVERAEERAERFEDYSENRAEDADRAHKAVAAIADNIPLGQPILVGHHSEKHARKDAEKIENGMRRAVKMWETAKYWEARAKGAIRHAKYKERPDVRARRIKGLEADARKMERRKAEALACLKLWESCKNLVQARLIAGTTQAGWLPTCKHPQLDQYLHPSDVLPFEDRDAYAREKYPTWTLEQVQEKARQHYPDIVTWCDRWLAHLANRLTYERAMLADAGGTVADRTGPEKGGAVQCWASPGHGNGWSYIARVNKVSVSVLRNWGNGGRRFSQTMEFDKLRAVMTRAQVEAARAEGRLHETEDKTGFFLSSEAPAPKPRPEPETPTVFDLMKDTLRAGVQVVSAPQLFPTPPEIARRLVELAGVQPGERVLEPSAGTGNLIRAIWGRFTGADCGRIVAVEINFALAEALRAQRDKTLYATEANFDIRCGDFLAMNGELGLFDRIVMNPPFERGADIEHIRHALGHLKPGGRLAAICANGPRQREAFMDEAEHWEDLEPGAFKESGTNVNAALVVLTK